MKISALQIQNFRGIRDVKMDNIGSIVIISGQNGSGKSCIFDAVRLLKSVYGGYQQNEWQQWMSEFQIPLGDRATDFHPMMNDPTREFRIIVDFELSVEEKDYIRSNLSELIRETIWRTVMPEAYGWGGLRLAHFANQFRDKEGEVAEREAQATPQLIAELQAPFARGECFIPANGTLHLHDSILLQVIFSTFRPKQLGVIDFHGAQRHYGRELVQGINLNLETQQTQQRSQTALYNYANKYNNVKSEMAASYVGEILAEQAGVPRASQLSLTTTLTELFDTFFPDKKFAGPQPTTEGTLKFPVIIANSGGTHDLDDLSAGEKEILYGYLRIRNSAPRFSIILLDEPELHLNPRLIRGLPQFYREHLGIRLDNQIWLVTHSDTLIREIIGRDGFDVFHMLPASTVEFGDNQAKRLSLMEDLPLLLTDLVGDLAAYRPVGKAIIFEGGGDSDFDQRMASTLFPELIGNVNLISGSNKFKVRALHELLAKVGSDPSLSLQFYSIVDRDTDAPDDLSRRVTNQFKWNVYHVENYLLEPEYMRQVLRSLGQRFLPEPAVILADLRDCARELISQIVRHEMTVEINRQLTKALNVGIDKRSHDLAEAFQKAIDTSVERVMTQRESQFSYDELRRNEIASRSRLDSQIEDGSWVINFPARDILGLYVGRRAYGVNYERFRNLIISKMADDRFKPEGMRQIIDQILKA